MGTRVKMLYKILAESYSHGILRETGQVRSLLEVNHQDMSPVSFNKG